MLFYQRSGSTNFDGAIAYNYRTGEWTDHVYGAEFIAALGYKQTVNTDMVRVAASSTLVYQLETGQDDNGTFVSRYHDIDWTLLNGPGNKWVMGGEFTFEKGRDCRVRISMAVDRSSHFIYPKIFDLRGDDPDEAYVRVSYDVPSPVFGTWFKFRVEFFHDGSTNVGKLVDFAPEVVPVNQGQQDTPAQQQVVKA
jgi:hypothetical protein